MIIKPLRPNVIDPYMRKPYPLTGKQVNLPTVTERMMEARGDIEILEAVEKPTIETKKVSK